MANFFFSEIIQNTKNGEKKIFTIWSEILVSLIKVYIWGYRINISAFYQLMGDYGKKKDKKTRDNNI